MNFREDLVMSDQTTLADLPDLIERLTAFNLEEARQLLVDAGVTPAGVALALEKLLPDLREGNRKHVMDRWMSIRPDGETVQ
jgi:ribosomal protein RSM22 (predicted rRNA methylase)